MVLNTFIADNLPFDLDILPDDCYLVGGAVRDVLLNRFRNYLDLDFVLPHSSIETARNIANIYRAGFVILDHERFIARVVFPHATIDFAQQEGNSIENDLLRRDYTINAIAYHCQERKIIDPLKGKQDLEQGIIRMVSRQNLKDDPLRLLRGYRQACQLNFYIESETRQTIKELTPFLIKVAAERVNNELSYLLASENSSYWLKEAFKDGLLSLYWQNIDEKKIIYLKKIDFIIKHLQEKFSYFNNINNQSYSIVKLACLTDDNPEIAEKELLNLKYSRQEIKSVITIIKYTPSLLEKDFINNLSAQYFFFSAVGKVFPSLAIFALANDVNQDLINLLLNRYFDDNDSVAHPKPLLTGNDLMKFLKISPSPLIKQLLTDVQIAYIEGKFTDQNGALQWIINHRL
ncbi:tRNA nucleotidyltransferase [Geminocystis sp. NIES-3708]|uniref:CCA tRNA nucleotidyltransferase n=1 Tax=Geminocystis sp. NIES-3708 TaxID=1615909 RepID=UPI0005FC8204|nr:CCA tRNA nucleotidyltransferase [Geminocystis sp. NIES-3708]BAQ61267.1 tRNA nucleotidyltransferase [Geminocystis sp. NIES-3708]